MRRGAPFAALPLILIAAVARFRFRLPSGRNPLVTLKRLTPLGK